MFLTQEDYRKIESWLKLNSKRDTDFDFADSIDGSETIAIVQGNKNKRIFLRDFINEVGTFFTKDLVNVSADFGLYGITFETAIQAIPLINRKEGLVITFEDTDGNWRIYQFIGELTLWNLAELWQDVLNWESFTVNSLLPDEEDITATEPDDKGNARLKFADKEYNPDAFSGLGYVILRKNLVEVMDSETGKSRGVVNYLYQDMIKKENTIYEIKYDFDLNGLTITIPENSVLRFNGGSLSNGTINYNNCIIDGTERLNDIESIGTKKLSIKLNILDLTLNGLGEVQFANREVTDKTTGYKILRKDLSFREQINSSNTVYEIRDAFDLNGEEFTISPEGVILYFNGGYIDNGRIWANNTKILWNKKSVIFGPNLILLLYGASNTGWETDFISDRMFHPDTKSLRYTIGKLAAGNSQAGRKTIVEITRDYELDIEPTSTGVNGQSGIDLVSNSEYIITGTLKVKSNPYYQYSLLSLSNIHDVYIHGSGKLIGDRETHDFLTNPYTYNGNRHDGGHGISMVGCQNIIVEGLTINQFTGDGIALDAIGGSIPNTNITIRGCNISLCRRLGISVIWADRYKIENCFIHDMLKRVVDGNSNDLYTWELSGKTYTVNMREGTNPGFCIDIEPNIDTTCKNGIIQNNILWNPRGLMITVGKVLYTTIDDEGFNNKSEKRFIVDNTLVLNNKFQSNISLGYSTRDSDITKWSTDIEHNDLGHLTIGLFCSNTKIIGNTIEGLVLSSCSKTIYSNNTIYSLWLAIDNSLVSWPYKPENCIITNNVIYALYATDSLNYFINNIFIPKRYIERNWIASNYINGGDFKNNIFDASYLENDKFRFLIQTEYQSNPNEAGGPINFVNNLIYINPNVTHKDNSAFNNKVPFFRITDTNFSNNKKISFINNIYDEESVKLVWKGDTTAKLYKTKPIELVAI